MAGQFDYVRLEDLMRERRTDDAMADLSRDFGISEATLEVNGVAPDLYLPPEDNEQVREILEDGEETQALKDVKKEHKKKDRLKRDKEALRQVAFILPDKNWLVEARGALMEKLGYPADFGEVFLDGYKLLQALGIQTPEDRDWVNRFRALYTNRHLDVIASTWHNNQVLDNSWYWSAGLSVSYGRIRLDDHLQASVGLSGLVMIHTSDPVINPQKHTAMITFSLMAFR
jgi:hypothetical protein